MSARPSRASRTPASPSTVPAYMAPGDAARHVGVSRSSLYLLMREGCVAYRQLGSRRLVDTASLVAFVDGLPGQAAAPAHHNPVTR